MKIFSKPQWKIAIFYAIAAPTIGSLVFTAAQMVDAGNNLSPDRWLHAIQFVLFGAVMGIGIAFIPAFFVGSVYAFVVVCQGGLRGTVFGRFGLSMSLGLLAGGLLGFVYGYAWLFLAACVLAAGACSALLEHREYFDWIAWK